MVLGRTKGSLRLPFFDFLGISAAEGRSPSKRSGNTSRAAAFPFVFLLTIEISPEVGGVGDERECGVVMACRTGETEDELLDSSASESERAGVGASLVGRCTTGDSGGCSRAEVARKEVEDGDNEARKRSPEERRASGERVGVPMETL